MNLGLPNQIAAPNRRVRLGLVPWSFEALTSQGSAVGDIGRSAALAREVLYAILSVDYYENTQHQVGRRI